MLWRFAYCSSSTLG